MSRPGAGGQRAAALLASIVLVAVTFPAWGADALPPDAWFLRPFDINLPLCAPRQRPEWCAGWLQTMEDSRPKVVDITVPEWQRVPFSTNLLYCTTLRVPDWCRDWKAAMKALSERAPYIDIAERLGSSLARHEAERLARSTAWTETVQRVGNSRHDADDFRFLERRAAEGEGAAMELLAWIYAEGRGVKVDYARAYELYAQAVLAGREDLRVNLEKLWPRLRPPDQARMRDKFRYPRPESSEAGPGAYAPFPVGAPSPPSPLSGPGNKPVPPRPR